MFFNSFLLENEFFFIVKKNVALTIKNDLFLCFFIYFFFMNF